MNRAILAATLLLVFPLAQLPTPAGAQVPPTPVPRPSGLAPSGVATPPQQVSPTPTPDIEEEGPRDKQQRIDIFQDRRLIYDVNKETQAYSLRQGPDPIFDVDFVELMDDPSLTRYWTGLRNRDWAFWLGSGAILVPAGLMVFFQNFQVGSPPGTFAFFASSSRTTQENVSDPRTFVLSLAGVVVAMYGAYNLGQWVLEELDQYHPNRLDADSILPRVHTFNDDLQEKLNLEPSDIPAPPTVRPSPTPTVSTSPSPGQLLVPSPGGPIDQSMPEGGPPAPMPTPLPIQEPGVVPSELVPSPKPMPSEFLFPGPPGRVPASELPSLAPAPSSPRPSRRQAKPTPTPTAVPYPGTEP